MNKIVQSLKDVDIRKLTYPICTIYKNPSDFPDNYVVRLFDLNRPTNIIIIRNSVTDCRADLMAAGFTTHFMRDFRDDPCIVESWMQ